MPVFTSSIELSDDYPTIEPSLKLNFARSRSLDPRITFTRPSVGTYVGRDGLIKTAGENEARFDHDPETLESLGLLLEEQRTNLVAYSEDFGNSSWSFRNYNNGNSASVNSNVDIAPDGTQTVDEINFVGDSSIMRGYRFSATASTTYTVSIWCRATNSSYALTIAFGLAGVRQSVLNAVVRLGTQSELVRRDYTFTTPSSNIDSVEFIIDKGGTSGDGYAYVWGAQVEEGEFPSSYIPTSGSTVTRAFDDAQILGASFSNTFNTLEGTFVAECDRGNDGNEGAGIGTMRRAADSYFNMIQFGELYDNSGYVARIYVDGTASAVLDATHTTGQGVYNKYSFAYKTNSVAAAINGVLQGEDTAASLPTELDRFLFGRYNNGGEFTNLDGHIKYLHYYPQRLTNSQLQLLTA